MSTDDGEKFRRHIAANLQAVAEALRPHQQLREALLAHMVPMMEVQRRLAAAVEPDLRQFEQFQQRLAETVAPALERFQELQTQLVPVFEQMGRAFQELPEKQRHALEVLAHDGWYLEPGMSFVELFQVARLLKDGKTNLARGELSKEGSRRLRPFYPGVSGSSGWHLRGVGRR